MSLPIVSEPVPLTTDAEGVFRVRGTRVTLETVVEAFIDGASAEEIACQYPSLDLADIYAVIAYYLRRRSEVDDYLRKRKTEAVAVRQENEKSFDPTGIRARLLARHRTA